MRFISDNFAAICVAAFVGALAWLYGGTRAALVVEVVPWMILFLLEIMLAFPQRHQGETTVDARDRVWRAMKKDPFFWTAFGLLVLLAIPFVNNGLCASCDRALIALGHPAAPPAKFLPFCVNRMQHLGVFLWFAAALSTTVVARHCLCRRGKRLALALIVWNGVLLAVLGFVQAASGAEGPLWTKMTNVSVAGTFFSTFGYPNMAGDYFTTMFGLSVALWRRACDDVGDATQFRHQAGPASPHSLFWRRNLYLVPALVFFFAAVNTLSRAAILLVTTLLLVSFAHAFVSFTHRMRRSERVRKGTIALAVVGLVAFFSLVSLPDDVQREVDTLSTTEVLTRVTGKGQYHTRVATELWKDNFLFGCGGWGYKHFCIPKMTREERRVLQTVGGINVHNDYLQFLAEHGAVGFGAMVALVLMLVAPVVSVWKRLFRAARFMDPRKAPPRPLAIFALPAPAFAVLTTAVATLVHGFGDCPLRSPAILSLFFVSLALIPGFLPKEKEDAAR